jgi:GNAT superfamily N-acetyltransferase
VSRELEIVRGGAELLDELEPLWLALRDHHGAVSPEQGPVRDDAGSWARRRASYERWLADGGAFVLVARLDKRVVAYAFVRSVAADSSTWQHEGTALELETLSVRPDARGTGVGAQLLGLVRDELDREGHTTLWVTAVAQNEGALRFYEREGLRPAFIVMQGSPRTR